MAKVAILVPYKEMCELTSELIGNYPHITPMCVEYIVTEEIEEKAKTLELGGCELIVARGLHASKIKRCVKLPVVEIRVTAQELGGLVLELHQELGVECPKVGLIGFENTLCDTSRFDELFQMRLQRYAAEGQHDDYEVLRHLVEQAQMDGCEAVLGGNIVCSHAEKLGLPCKFIPSGVESMQSAFAMADQICYAIDMEKNNSAERNTMLDYTFSGIMQVDTEGVILRANRVAFNLLNIRPVNMIGSKVTEVLPQLEQSLIDKALHEGREAYAILVPIQKRTTVVNIAPIIIDDTITGGILTFQEGQRITEMDGELRRELYQMGFVASYTFDKLPAKSHTSQKLIKQARIISKYNAPVLLFGEDGVGKIRIAQSIHNESFSRRNAFIPIDCRAVHPDTLDTMLFGNYTTRKDTKPCMVEVAQNGTIYLAHVEEMSPELQYKILRLINGSYIHNGATTPTTANVRIIASSDSKLISRVEQGEFRNDLYYALNVLSLDIPPLRRCREDILEWVDFYLRKWQEHHKRYVSLTQGAKELLQEYNWPGNLSQLSSLCERVVLLTDRRSVDEVFLSRQLDQVAPAIMPGTEQIVLFKDKKAMELAQLLKKHSGNRQKVADELGISKTTLWRYIKKYNIEKDFSF